MPLTSKAPCSLCSLCSINPKGASAWRGPSKTSEPQKVKIEAPNFVALSDFELEGFWRVHRVSDIRNLGDRLLAECLPRFPARGPHYYPANLTEQRQAIPMTVAQVGLLLGVTEAVVMAWESDMMRPPASLSLIYKMLKEHISSDDPTLSDG